MQAKLDLKKEEARAQFQERIAQLKEKRAEASAKLDEIRNSSDDAWEKVKDGAGRIREEFNETVKEVEAALR